MLFSEGRYPHVTSSSSVYTVVLVLEAELFSTVMVALASFV